LKLFGWLKKSKDDFMSLPFNDIDKKAKDSTAFSVNLISSLWKGGKSLEDQSYARFVDAYKSWVYTCVDKISKSVAMIPLNLYVFRQSGRKTILGSGFYQTLKSFPDSSKRRIFLKAQGIEEEQITDHPFLDLMNRPNGIMTRFMLWYETMVRLELSGSCCWLLIKDKMGIPREIWPLPLTKTASIQPEVSPDAKIQCWLYMDGNIRTVFNPEDVLFFHYPSPASPFKGMSPLLAQAYPYDLDLFLLQHQRNIFLRGADPLLHLHTDQVLTQDQLEEMRRYIQDRFAGPNKAGETLITHSGLQASKLSPSNREMMLNSVERFVRDRLITSFDLSPGKVGLVEDVNRANAEALNETFLNECLRPKIMLIEETIEQFLLPIYDDGLTCNFQMPDYGDREMRLRERESRLSHFLSTINEERVAEGLDPVPWGDAPWIPNNLVQFSSGMSSSSAQAQQQMQGELLLEKIVEASDFDSLIRILRNGG